MPQWQGKSKGGSAGYKFFVFLIKTFGISFSYFFLRFVTLYYFFFSAETSRHILDFYQNKLKFSWFRSRIKLYQNYYMLGQTLIDKIAVMAKIPTNFSFDFDGEHNLREMVSLKKGGLLLSGHAGNWEAAGHLLQRLNTRINIVMYDGEDAQIKKYMDEVTGQKTFQIIFVKEDLSHIYKINQALASNELVCIHADRFLPENKTLSTEFFGSLARFPEGPFLLALKLKVPIVYVYAFKESNSHYHFYSTKIKYFYQHNGDSIQSVLNDFALDFQGMVKKYPEQWFNYYDFWQQ
ncbi:MAG: lysophospholipid acyltransferase family protein [Bacteroidetes bacterium]|nr:lysophospholipid acyltransferase family protein [Bacteroidota bacterium]HET6244605.1 lysophospholipid acyltransferase family protein [Bacteroidia bacterium]